MSETRIEWTEATWNPTTGCTKASDGCLHCYAERMAKRLQAMGVENYRDGFAVRVHEKTLEAPYLWSRPRMIFVNSMSDLFHNEIPDEFILRIFKVMNETPRHTYQFLTKRPERLVELDRNRLLRWSPNIWAGVTIENAKYANRADLLKQTRAYVKFISFEPLLGLIDEIDLSGIDWAIVGGESGPSARPMNKEWVYSLRDQCIAQNVKFFFKQWGGVIKKRNGRLLDGKTWDETPSRKVAALF